LPEAIVSLRLEIATSRKVIVKPDAKREQKYTPKQYKSSLGLHYQPYSERFYKAIA